MNILKKMLLPKDAKIALTILDAAEEKFKAYANAFRQVRQNVEVLINSDPRYFSAVLRESGRNPSLWIYSAICNISGDLAESGQYHIYRGFLSPLGEKFLAIYDLASDHLVALGGADENFAEEQKKKLREGIASVG